MKEGRYAFVFTNPMVSHFNFSLATKTGFTCTRFLHEHTSDLAAAHTITLDQSNRCTHILGTYILECTHMLLVAFTQSAYVCANKNRVSDNEFVDTYNQYQSPVFTLNHQSSPHSIITHRRLPSSNITTSNEWKQYVVSQIKELYPSAAARTGRSFDCQRT